MTDNAFAILFRGSQTVRATPHGKLDIRFRAGGLQEMAWRLMTWGEAVPAVEREELSELM